MPENKNDKSNMNGHLLYGSPLEDDVPDMHEDGEHILLMGPLDDSDSDEPESGGRRGARERRFISDRKHLKSKDTARHKNESQEQPDNLPRDNGTDGIAPEISDARETDGRAAVTEKKQNQAEGTPAEKAYGRKKSEKDAEKAKKGKKSGKKEKASGEDCEKKEPAYAVFVASLAAKLLLICAVCAALLAFVNYITAPVIAQNELLKKEEALKGIFPSLTEYTEIQTDGFAQAEVNAVYLIKSDGVYTGYCADITTNGFGGGINMIVGVDADSKIAGIKIISHSETAGVGTNAMSEGYLSSYTGLGGTNIMLGSGIDAYSGATISSRAVNAGINAALDLAEYVRQDAEASVTGKAVYTEQEALKGFYGWVTEEVTYTPAETESLYFDSLSYVKAEGVNAGYTGVMTVSTEFDSAKIMVGTWFGQLIGVKFLEYSGENFDKIARDAEYMSVYRPSLTEFTYGSSIPAYPDADAEARLIAGAAERALSYYSEYTDIVNSQQEEASDE